MIRRTAFAFVTAAALLAGPAAAQSASDADLRCMLVASRLSQSTDAQTKNISSLMVFYYLGRLDARRPGLNLGAALQAEARTIVPTEMNPVVQKCVSTLEARGKVLEALGKPPAGAAPAAKAN